MVGEDHQIRELTLPRPDLSGEERLRIESERAEHLDRELLSRKHLDDELRQPAAERLDDRAPGQRGADALPTMCRVNDEADLTDVA